MAAFCWVTWSIWLTAVLTWLRPMACSCDGLGDLGDQGVDLGHLDDDAVERLAGVAHQLDAALDLFGAGRDQAP